MRYQWILFDLDDTLLDFRSSARVAFSALMEELQVPESPDLFVWYLEANHRAWADFEKGQITALELRSKRFRDFVALAGLEGLPEPTELNARYLTHLTRHTFVVDGANDLLQSLQGRVKLGIVTNGLKEVQRPRIQQAGMTSFFSEVLVSDELGVAKPSKAFYSLAHEKMDFPPKHKVLVVGDSRISDIFGAMQFGFEACWYNPSGQRAEDPCEPAFEARSLSDIQQWLFAPPLNQ